MRVVRVEVAPFALPLRAALRTGHGVQAERAGFVVRVEDEAGRAGFGEATPLPTHGTEVLGAAREALHATGAFVGREIADTGSLDALLGGSAWEGAPAARFAAELALLDLLAQARGVALAELLASGARRDVPVNALLAATAPHDLEQEARARAAEGFKAFKLKVGGRPLAEELARVRSLRSGAGSEAELRLDANGAWSLAEARAALPALHREGTLSLCEQPVAGLDDLGALSKETEVPLAADELLSSPAVAREVIARRAAAVLVLKPMVLGGIRPALALAVEAGARGLGVLVTSTVDGAIARTGALHLAAALPGPRLACGLATGPLLARDLAPDPAAVHRGVCSVPQVPGLGVRPTSGLSWEAP